MHSVYRLFFCACDRRFFSMQMTMQWRKKWGADLVKKLIRSQRRILCACVQTPETGKSADAVSASLYMAVIALENLFQPTWCV